MRTETYIEDGTNEWFKHESLQLLAGQLAVRAYAGYPCLRDRLWLDDTEDLWEPVVLPDGPWETSGGELPNIGEQAALSRKGLRLDSYGRPLHPWFDSLLRHPGIGVVTGKGAYWRWGPNYTADPIVLRHDLPEPHVLLIERRDTGLWALPGGFVDEGETPLAAARREAGEEARIDLSDYPASRQVYSGPLADLRVTAHAWPETTAYRFDLPDTLAKRLPVGPYPAGDDARRAKWLPIEQVGDELFGSHRLLVELALTA